METEQVAVQPTVGSIAQTPQNAFVVPNGELKDFYLKFALLLNPNSCSANRTEFELLNILLKDLKKLWEHSLTSPCMPGMMVYRKSCSHAVLTPYKTT